MSDEQRKTPDWDPSTDELQAIADVLLGASAADGQYDHSEIQVIVDALCELTGKEALPDEMVAHLKAFEPTDLDLEQTCERIDLEGAGRREALMRMVVKVAEADEIHDLDEEHYIMRLALIIGVDPGEFAAVELQEVVEEGAAPPATPPATPPKPPPAPGADADADDDGDDDGDNGDGDFEVTIEEPD